MDWQSVPKGFSGALAYSARYHYPLTLQEIWFWQVGTSYKKPSRFKFPHISKPVSRVYREKVSRQKLSFAQKKLSLLSKNPFTSAIFITGSLAVNNCTPNDDIDLMIISYPHTLWLSRLVNIFILSHHNLRRPFRLPEHSSPKVKDKFCDNLYLDYKSLHVGQNNLYTAHEILQAKPLFDPHHLHYQFLQQNFWVKDYLPIAYQETLKNAKSSNFKPGFSPFWWTLNILAFAFQYLYMRPKITSEIISLNQAFFHPRRAVV